MCLYSYRSLQQIMELVSPADGSNHQQEEEQGSLTTPCEEPMGLPCVGVQAEAHVSKPVSHTGDEPQPHWSSGDRNSQDKSC
jgi:hypothetical protein